MKAALSPSPRKTRGSERTHETAFTEGLKIRRRTRTEWPTNLTKAQLKYLGDKGYYSSWPQPDYTSELWIDAEKFIPADTGKERVSFHTFE